MADGGYSRKDFLKMLGIGAASLTFRRLGIAEEKGYAADIGFQLYTIRREIEKDFDGTVHKVADMGFRGVECYPLPSNTTPKHAASVFKESGLKIFSMHTELPVGDERENILRVADAYSCDHIVYPGWPKGISPQDPDLMKKVGEIFKTVDDTKRRADLYNEISVFFQKKGLHFGLHNHWWEFEKSDGIVPYYYFLEHLDPHMFFEIDTYWAKTGGADPAKAVADFGKRAPFLHIKDGTAKKDSTMFAQVPVGTGSLNFPAIVKAGGINTKWMIVEFDEYAGNIFDGLQQSYTYLTANNLAKGNK
ncbi:MAG TPA: sugar phosphate isomerase/epimerase [Bacteroidota bacterium]|nr:sugar phosphate isomerase/epimerase [Bacteroidota bacterium]